MSFKICIVGCGYMAMNGHGPMLSRYAAQREGVELSGCCDIVSSQAQAFASAFGFGAAYTDPAQMLREVRPQAVVLAVPVHLTARLAVEILRQGIPLLTEKPPGLTVEEGQAIARAARLAGVPASAAFNRRTMPLVQALQREIEKTGLPVWGVSTEMCRVDRRDADFTTTAIHDIDLARYLCRSDYLQATMTYALRQEAAPATDMAVAAHTENGIVVTMGFYPVCGVLYERVTVRLLGHEFKAELPVFSSVDGRGRILHYEGNRLVGVIEGEELHPAEANGFLAEITAFMDALRAGETPPHSVEDSLQSLELACAMSRRELRYDKPKGGQS